MAKRAFSILRHFSTQTKEEAQLKNIAANICEIIRTQPRWETTLNSQFPTFNFQNPKIFDEVMKIQDNVFLNYRLYNWLSSHPHPNGFSADPISCNSLFVALIDAKAVTLAKQLLDDNVPNFGPEKGYLERLFCCLINDGFFEMGFDLYAKFGICGSIGSWNKVLSGAIRCKRTDVFWRLYEEMMSSGVVADVETVGYLIQAFCIDGKVESGYELLRQVRVAPDNVAINRLISGLSKGGDYSRVSELLHGMIATNQNPDLFTYQGVIYGLCKSGGEREAYRIFSDLKDRGYAPDTVMYTTMIQGLCRVKWMEKAKMLWGEMVEKCVLPNEYTYNALIYGYCKNSDVEEAWKLIKEMREKGYKLNTVNYNTLIGGLCKNGKAKEACSLFEEMPQMGVARDVITYNPLIRGFCRQGDWAKGLLLFEELVAYPLRPSTSSYTPLIEQLCRVGRTQQALELWTDMLNRAVEPSLYNSECIIDGLCREGSVVDGTQWLSHVLSRKLIPRQKIFETLIKCLSEQEKLDDALLVLSSMLRVGYKLNTIVCGSLVNKLCAATPNSAQTHLFDIVSTSQAPENP